MKKKICLISLLIFLSQLLPAQNPDQFLGKWKLIRDKSSDIDLYGNLTLEFIKNGKSYSLIRIFGTGRNYYDTIPLNVDKGNIEIPVTNRVFPTNSFMGLSMPVGGKRQIRASWENNGKILRIDEQFNIRSSQGSSPVRMIHRFRLADNEESITYSIERSTRTKGEPIQYLLKKDGYHEAYFMNLKDEWEVAGGLDENAMLISLQGLANADGPKLYFIYPETWDFIYIKPVFKFYKDDRLFTFKELKTPEAALKTFSDKIKGYIVWDKNVRSSLIVAFTAAGIYQGVVVSEDLIPVVEKAGLKMITDLRGKFTGWDDTRIYQWAYDNYWKDCNKDLIIWMGGDYGKIMKPGVADWGIYKKAFFNDLSTLPQDTSEYRLASKLLSEMYPHSMVMGWHSYGKDKERDFVTLTSHYGYRVEGLHTLPNLSFSSQVPLSKGFQFKNHHQLVPDSTYKAEKKVYISCVQTDGIGLGAWDRPGRGEIPYAWELTMNYLWMAPAMLEFFYSNATPNDYFIGGLSGPGYMYPKAVPPEMLPDLLKMATDMMDKLDLNVFEIMDYSEGATVEGNTELTKKVTDTYYKYMPKVLGFINGYAPAFTFAVKDKKALISFDYYLSPYRTVEEAVGDLEELATINSKRPYFLLVHVREYSDIKRVRAILNLLSDQFELVPLDVFLRLAGDNPTYEERFLKK